MNCKYCNIELGGKQTMYCSPNCRKKHDYKMMTWSSKKILIQKKVERRKPTNWQLLKDITPEQAALYTKRRNENYGRN